MLDGIAGRRDGRPCANVIEVMEQENIRWAIQNVVLKEMPEVAFELGHIHGDKWVLNLDLSKIGTSDLMGFKIQVQNLIGSGGCGWFVEDSEMANQGVRFVFEHSGEDDVLYYQMGQIENARRANTVQIAYHRLKSENAQGFWIIKHQEDLETSELYYGGVLWTKAELWRYGP